MFLSPDGIRTVAGTARIGDVELGSVSRQIQGIVTDIAANSGYIISSAVLRSKSQYRLFYSTNTESPSIARGIIGTLTPNGFAWAETLGIQALGMESGLDSDGIEQVYHGDKDGYIYNHLDGTSFYNAGTATDIAAVYQTPDFDFGDVGTRKTLKYARFLLVQKEQSYQALEYGTITKILTYLNQNLFPYRRLHCQRSLVLLLLTLLHLEQPATLWKELH